MFNEDAAGEEGFIPFVNTQSRDGSITQFVASCGLQGKSYQHQLKSTEQFLIVHRHPQSSLLSRSDARRSQYGPANNRPLDAGDSSQILSTRHEQPMGVCRTLYRTSTDDSCSHKPSIVSSILTNSSFVYRENRVPHYQRLLQKHDGKRQWWKVSEPFSWGALNPASNHPTARLRNPTNLDYFVFSTFSASFTRS